MASQLQLIAVVIFGLAITYDIDGAKHLQREQTFVLKCAMQGGKVEDADNKQVCLVHESIKGEFK